MRSKLDRSMARLKAIHDVSIVLNPTENIPLCVNTIDNYAFVQGMYVTDQLRDDIEATDPKIIFGGRTKHILNVKEIQLHWAELLGAEVLSFRLLSGLHMYMALFMSIGCIGDTVLILPEEAGGHFSVGAILDRLGYKILHMNWDADKRCVDMEKTNKMIDRERPRFILVDRSEGVNYEDFSRLKTANCDLAIFDASQYLTNIIAGDFDHPFDSGFNAVVATIHKNFPGPQKAFVAFKKRTPTWDKLENALRLYVSNTHVYNTYLAGLSLADIPLISRYSRLMLDTAKELERNLDKLGISVVRASSSSPRTHHIWIHFEDKQSAFRAYKNLEWHRVYTNYRLLPYRLGHGLRLGTAWSTLMGLNTTACSVLAEVMARIIRGERSLSLRHEILAMKRAWTPLLSE